MKYFIAPFILFYLYAIVRYHLGKGLDNSYFLFVFNKAIAWTSSFYLGISILTLPNKFPAKKQYGLSAFALGIIHITVTLILTFSDYYPEFYNKNGITQMGVSILITGLLSISLMFLAFLASLFPGRFPKIWLHCGFFAFLINMFHPALIGFQNWFSPFKWPLYLPPITLLASLISVAIFYLRWKQKKGD
jgi:hypothetical protein